MRPKAVDPVHGRRTLYFADGDRGLEPQKPFSRFATWCMLGIFVQFLLCGLAVFVNLFVPFLSEGLFAIIALVLFAEIFIAIVAGKIMQGLSVLSGLRKAAEEASRAQNAQSPDLES